MSKAYRKQMAIGMVMTLLFALFIPNKATFVFAKETSEMISGTLYEFEEKSSYEITSNVSKSQIGNAGNLGAFSIAGDIKAIPDVKGFKAFQVQHTDVSNRKENEGIVMLSYVLGTRLIGKSETEWHITEDKSSSVNGIKLDSKVQNGTVILQTSLDGKEWVTDVVKTNIAGEKSEYKPNFYNTKGIQQVNGCYYRVTVVYKTEKRVEDTKLGPITQKHYEYKKYAEVYEFYLIDSYENSDRASSSSATPKKELGKVVKMVKDKGFAEAEPITSKDPHFGWKIGTFYLNGYTREQPVKENETPIFLKTLGDRVTLWFSLDKKIDDLDGSGKLSINEDKNGYDREMGVKPTNFKHGALIIRFTDNENHPHDPVIYTDYLAACATTGANTKVELFEEGDYEVALDYEIKNDALLDEYTNYQISFKFKIRNGNCMVYPFDLASGAELSDKAIAENGFKLDLAKSRYLLINYTRSSVKKSNDRYSLDVRENSVAEDGKLYTTEGIYTFKVENPSTNETTTKTIYVGSSPIFKALAGGKTVEAVNDLLDQGGILQEDGSILIPVPEEPKNTEPETIPENDKEDTQTESSINEAAPTPAPTQMEESNLNDSDNEVQESATNAINTEIQDESKNGNIWIFVVAAIVIAAIAYFGITTYKRKGIRIDVEKLDNEEAEQ